jgi:hypothetical protein
MPAITGLQRPDDYPSGICKKGPQRFGIARQMTENLCFLADFAGQISGLREGAKRVAAGTRAILVEPKVDCGGVLDLCSRGFTVSAFKGGKQPFKTGCYQGGVTGARQGQAPPKRHSLKSSKCPVY